MQTRYRPLLTATAALAMIAGGLATASGQGAATQPGYYAPACAKPDLEAVIFIEERGAANELPSETLGKAGLQLLDARNACLSGRIAEAVALYDGILRIEPVAVAEKK